MRYGLCLRVYRDRLKTNPDMQFLTARHAPETIAAKTNAVREALLRESRLVRVPNFVRIADLDLARLFDRYDAEFFDGWLRRQVEKGGTGRLTFRLAPRMSKTGGTTTRFRRKRRQSNGSGLVIQRTDYEIAISTRLLFLTFGNGASAETFRPVTVCGLACLDRLAALQRIMEHEALHLAEMLVWNQSSCAAPRFKRLAGRLFGHLESTHDLVTPAEQAKQTYDLRVGDAVRFDHEGRTLAGVVNRINRRATVLVESDRGGVRYSDGRHYQKFYVPLTLLRKAGE